MTNQSAFLRFKLRFIKAIPERLHKKILYESDSCNDSIKT